jgi:hypothetical protein
MDTKSDECTAQSSDAQRLLSIADLTFRSRIRAATAAYRARLSAVAGHQQPVPSHWFA